MNIYVGNLPFETTEDSLQVTFTEYGSVDTARVITDRMTGRSRGFGFIEMPNNDEAEEAIKALNGKDFNGRALTVNEARPREDRPSGGSGGSGGGGGGGGYGGSGGGGGGGGQRW
jgi:RNA recognition motif-containing protein